MSKIHDWKGQPNPGSNEAIVKGCICAVIDNHYGRGVNGSFWITGGCPLHDPQPTTDKIKDAK